MEIIADDASPSGETWQTVKPTVAADLNAHLDTLPTRWKSNPFPASSSTFQTFGCLILGFGWYGFNCVSTLAISAELSGVAAKVAVTTTCGAAGGALSAFAIVYILDGFQDLGAISNGILAGLVSITAACSVIEPWAAFLIGVIGGAVYVGACKLLEKLRIDDVVLAIPVHCFCGMWGVLAAGLFATQNNYAAAYTTPENPEACVVEDACGTGNTEADCYFTAGDKSTCDATKCAYTAPIELPADGGVPCGIFYGCDNGGSQFMAQLIFVLAVFAWTATTMTLLLFATKAAISALTGFEKTAEHATPLAYCKGAQMKGMDMMKHGGMASPETVTTFSGKSGVDLWDGVPSSPSRAVVKQAFPGGVGGQPGTFATWFADAPGSPGRGSRAVDLNESA
jgi:ammonia channel protein AmtB